MAGVVVGMGRGGASDRTVRWAADEAVVRGLTLTLVHAWDEPVDVTVDLDASSLPELSGPATSQAVSGSAADVLLTQQAELLVLGGRPDARHLSQLTRTVLHRAQCPVVVLHHTDQPVRGQVVVGVCGTDASREALRWGADEARRRGARLAVVHAWQVHPTSPTEALHPARAVTAQGRTAQQRLEGWIQATLGTAPVELLLVHGPRLEALLEASRDADLLVLGRGLHSVFDRLLHGTIGDDLSALASCPVVGVPAKPRTPALPALPFGRESAGPTF